MAPTSTSQPQCRFSKLSNYLEKTGRNLEGIRVFRTYVECQNIDRGSRLSQQIHLQTSEVAEIIDRTVESLLNETGHEAVGFRSGHVFCGVHELISEGSICFATSLVFNNLHQPRVRTSSVPKACRTFNPAHHINRIATSTSEFQVSSRNNLRSR